MITLNGRQLFEFTFFATINGSKEGKEIKVMDTDRPNAARKAETKLRMDAGINELVLEFIERRAL